MMREILFRGKRIDNGEWVYGYYVPACFGRFPCRPAIVQEPNGEWRPIEVNPETVVQYTGLTDKNGKKIFDGDVLFSECAVDEYSLILIRDEGWRCFMYYYFDGKCYDTESVKSDDWLSDCEVIGNIHDNPELLEVAE